MVCKYGFKVSMSLNTPISPQVFIPDKSNGVDVQGESDAKLDHDRKQKEMAVLAAFGKNRYRQ
jgi:hypothetical protein